MTPASGAVTTATAVDNWAFTSARRPDQASRPEVIAQLCPRATGGGEHLCGRYASSRRPDDLHPPAAAAPQLAHLHHRMPVVLGPCSGAGTTALTAWPVSAAVSSVANNGPSS